MRFVGPKSIRAAYMKQAGDRIYTICHTNVKYAFIRERKFT